jgi:hypothetical protein
MGNFLALEETEKKKPYNNTQSGKHTVGRKYKTREAISQSQDTTIYRPPYTEILQKIFPVANKDRFTLPSHLYVKSLLHEGNMNNSCEFARTSSMFDNERISLRTTEAGDNGEIGLTTQGVINNEYELSIKNADDLRKKYIAKLIYANIWQPISDNKEHNSIVIFDWDDTLLPTSFLTPNGIFSDDLFFNENELQKISDLEKSVHDILRMSITKADTYIITNAAPGWVEYSSKRFYPTVYPMLKSLKIVSARGEFEKKHPGNSRQWKIEAFLKMLKNLDTNLVTNLICLGDSIIEMEAAYVLASNFRKAFIKTIKFRESPKPEELNKQLKLVLEKFSEIYSAVKSLVVKVDKNPMRRKSNIKS